jgi:Methyltransferase domain
MTRLAHTGPAPTLDRPRTELETWFWNNRGRLVHKWHHYLPIYERYFAPFRTGRVRMLEIGVSRGGSMAMWRDYFGPQAVIFGIDINPACATLDGESGRVRIGSQDDPDFLRGVVEEMGGIDIVLDDGSHLGRHMRASFETLFPLLSEGGVYMIEDLQTAYWGKFAGPLLGKSFLRLIPQMIDDMNHWYHPFGQRIAATTDHLAAIHVHDAMAVFEKARVVEPRHSRVGE